MVLFEHFALAAHQHETKGLNPALRGQSALPDSALYEEILRRYFQGRRFQKTRFTEPYTFNDYQLGSAGDAFASMIVKPSGALVLGSHEGDPDNGDALINFIAATKAA